ncbi:hypothetical protein [Candidatus Tisiphia endosymbiont of Parasteatoda lunata]|uniref:hypothetical protein n=1 Tax=Candidatus Tisiphia endosymbiont of Parasteatoda lunata TaxID=3066275 RepID=UPI00313DB8B2
MAHLESVTTQKNISVKCKILLKNILSFLDKIFKIYVETTHCKCGVFLPKWDNKMNENKNPTIINKVGDWFKYVANDIEDKLHNNKQYYQPKVTAESLIKVVEVLQQTSVNLAQNNQLQEGLNNFGKMLTNSNKQEPKINTKLQEDIMTNYASTQDNIKNKNMTNNINYDFINKQESLKLKQLLSQEFRT